MVRIEYWARIRVKSGSMYVTIPRNEAYKLYKAVGEGEKLTGREVRVEVTL